MFLKIYWDRTPQECRFILRDSVHEKHICTSWNTRKSSHGQRQTVCVIWVSKLRRQVKFRPHNEQSLLPTVKWTSWARRTNRQTHSTARKPIHSLHYCHTALQQQVQMQLAMGRKLRTTRLANLEPKKSDTKKLKERDEKAKNANKKYFDRRRGAKNLPELTPGDIVLQKQDHERQWQNQLQSSHSYIVQTSSGNQNRTPPPPPPPPGSTYVYLDNLDWTLVSVPSVTLSLPQILHTQGLRDWLWTTRVQ